MVCVSKKSDGNEYIIFEGRKRENFNIIVINIGNHMFQEPPLVSQFRLSLYWEKQDEQKIFSVSNSPNFVENNDYILQDRLNCPSQGVVRPIVVPENIGIQVYCMLHMHLVPIKGKIISKIITHDNTKNLHLISVKFIIIF